MRVSTLKLAAFAAVALTATSFASTGHDHTLCSGFVPENDMKIPVGQVRSLNRMDTPTAGISEEQFNQVIDRVEKLYAAEFTEAGAKLQANRKWNDPTVNASAQQSGTTWIINMYGGLARHAAINVEGFALVACHEIGHHIGGAPKKESWWGSAWATNEGGSDYFATLKCLRKYFAEDDNETIIANTQIEPLVQSNCETQFATRQDQLICMRSSIAGMSVATLFMDLRKETKQPKFDTPDTKVVRQMDHNHPGTQCRLDTYFQGAICKVDVSARLSNSDYREGSCAAPVDTVGLRPLCWFKPD